MKLLDAASAPRLRRQNSPLLPQASGRAASIAVLSLILMAGCATTSLTSMINPQWESRPFNRVLVLMAVDDLDVRREVETGLAEHTEAAGTELVPSFQILFPGDSYTQEEVVRILTEQRIDGALLITQGQSGTNTNVLPTTTTTGCSLWTSSQGCVQTRSTTSGGGTVSKPWAEYSVFFLDLHSMETAWIASASSSGNAFAGWDDLRSSMIDETLKALQADGILR